MEKLEVGMFIRDTRKGKIYKLTDFDLDFRPQKTTYDFEKASHNIIDLIEKHDVVVDKAGDKYEVIDKVSDWKVIVNHLVLDTSTGEYFNKQLFKDDITKVLTKEQFENNCFRMGDK